MKKIIVLLLLTGLAACGSTKLLTPTQTDADRMSKQFPGVTLADLQQGKFTFENNCGKCHSLQKPFFVPAATVEKVLPEMAKKANIDSKGEAMVLQYILAAKSAGKK